ncbi:MAG: glycoside hydrolase [Verrucomicrobia bacterium]|nr:glycoside hydrolase [Verrucomicrobiota bacterium]
MRLPRRFAVLSVFFALSVPFFARAADSASALGWPEITRENKPWTRWWWPGSGVDKASLTAQLEKFAAAGLGGVEITPIYGAKGYEDRYIDFLSPKWMEMLEHVGREAQRLGLGVDMATGTGWPFGGPWVTPSEAAAKALLRDGRIVSDPTKQMVKRAAPGGEGLVVDPYSPDALRKYLAPFDTAFARFPRGLVRGQFHDSFEYFQASWTDRLPEVFREMHGYDIQQYAAEIMARNAADVKTVDRDTLARIKSDYRNTLAKLHLDYLRTWVEWSHAHGFIVRNQSHGAPANLLDLYATVDIPETEIFGSTPFPIPGLRRDPVDVRGDQDLPESLVIRMPSSAAHVAGRKLASSESLTWLREHFRESPSHMKPELDRILCDGINHIFYHGTVFSPSDAPWPGWLFYASTEFNPNNPLWDDLAALNRYVARVQSVLQAGKPDNDILLYWPADDIWDNADGLMRMLTVHDVKWLTEQPVGKLAQQLLSRGYQFDYISDAQLQQTSVNDTEVRVPAGIFKQIATPGARYAVVLVPATRRMPVATLEKLSELAASGAAVIFEKLPEDVPGFGRLEERRKKFAATLAAGKGKWRVREDDVELSIWNFSQPEPMAREGLRLVRRARADGYDYFVANLGAKPFHGFARFGRFAWQSVDILDPLTGRMWSLSREHREADGRGVSLPLEPGESRIIRTYNDRREQTRGSGNFEKTGAVFPLEGQWSLTFLKGGPDLPPALTTVALKSWTDLGRDEAKRFGGTARYRLEFDAPAAKAVEWMLDLGDVRETARVRLNGEEIGTAWCVPFQIRFSSFLLKPTKNILELDVTNLAANRIRDLDLKKVNWKIMREINFVNINYRPFDASGWAPVASGLLGPVTLTPLKAFTP